MAEEPAAPRPLFQTPNLRLPLFRQATPAPRDGEGPDPLLSREAVRDLNDLYTAAAAIQDAQTEQTAKMSRLMEAIQADMERLARAQRTGVSQSITLKASQAVILDTQGYKHSYLLLTATQAVLFDIPGLGSVSRNLAVDWNRLDYPSGTRITIATDPSSPVNALLRLQDEPIDV